MREDSRAGTTPGAGSNPVRDRSKRRWVWAGFIALFVFHQDSWWWDDRHFVFGFLPIGLAYHALLTLAAGLLWALASRYAWPSEIEEWAEESSRMALPAAEGSDSAEVRL